MAFDTGTDPTLAELITAKFIPQKYSKDVLMHTMSNLVVANQVHTELRSQLRKGSVVNVSVMSEVTDTEVTPGTVPTARDAAGTPVSVTVNKWREATVEISDMADIQDEVGYLDNAAKSCAYRIVKRVDTDLGALFSTLNASSVYGADGQTLSDELILAITETLDEADVPNEGRCLITDPSGKNDCLNIDKFVHANYGGGEAVRTGLIGEKYGMPFLFTNNLTVATTGNYGVIMHRDAVALVMQKDPRTQTVRIPQEFRTLVIVDVIYGVGELRDTFGQAFYTRKS